MISIDFRRVEPKEIAGCRNLLGISRISEESIPEGQKSQKEIDKVFGDVI